MRVGRGDEGALARLARLGALRHLDLQLVGVGEVPDRHAEPARGDLLDLRDGDVAILQPLEVREGGGVACVMHGLIFGSPHMPTLTDARCR